MFHFLLEFTEIRVALLAEGVDRNKTFQFSGVKDVSRPPRGGRG